jgi:methylated-DNA-protein-cysteine methyltransferase-like protein
MESGWKPVYDLVRKIPKGKVVSYGVLARVLRLRGGARTAGRAMAACPSGMGIPWHRVVGAGGRILVQEPSASMQRRLLESEGSLTGGRADMKRHEWTPPGLRRKAKARRPSSRAPRNVV